MEGNNNYLANGHFTFGNVIQFLKEGKACRRSGWNGKGLFIVKQVPAHITGDIIRGTAKVDVSKFTGLPLTVGGLYQVADYDAGTDKEKAFAVNATMGLSNFAKPAEIYAQYLNTSDFRGTKDRDVDQIIIGGTYKYQPNMIAHLYAGKQDIDNGTDKLNIGGGLEYLF